MRTLGTLALAISLSAALPARATTYYVRTDGSDVNSGLGNTLGEAFATVQHAADLVNPGDVVAVQAGVYSEVVTLTRSGASNSPITFRADGEVQGTRFITNSGPGSWPFYRRLDLYTVIDGFHFVGAGGATDSSDAGILTQGVSNLTIQNCTFELLGAGVYLRGAIFTQDTYITLRNNTFRNNGNGLDANTTDHVVVEDCTFSNNSGYGIVSGWGMPNSRVDRCTFSGNGAGVYLRGTDAYYALQTVNTRVSRSTFVGNAQGLAIGPYADNNEVVNNVFLRHWAFGLVVYSGTQALANNAFVGNHFAVDVGPYGQPVAATNNLFWQNDSNLYSQNTNWGIVPVGSGSLQADPMFVDPAAPDVALLPGSPCIDAGDPAYDADPARRGQHVDIGAVEWNETVPPVSTVALLGPAGDAGWYVGPVTAQLSATDVGFGVKELRFALDGAAEVAAPGAAAEVAVTTEGSHTLAFHAVDFGDNVEALNPPVEFRIDATAPVTSVRTSPTTLKSSGKLQPVAVTVTASDAIPGVETSGVASVSIVVKNASGGVVANATGTSATFQLAGEKGQRYTVTATATDLAGNKASATAAVTVK